MDEDTRRLTGKHDSEHQDVADSPREIGQEA